MKKTIIIALLAMSSLAMTSCKNDAKKVEPKEKALVEQYAVYELKTDLTKLSEKEKQMLPILMKAADQMEKIFWKEAYGDKAELMAKLPNEYAKTYASINYGPWDRLEGNAPFIAGFDAKPLGAGYYPKDITKEEFAALDDEAKNGWYNVLRRDEKGGLKVVPYHVEFAKEIKETSKLLKQAAELAEDAGLKKYLNLRAEALLTDDYLASDLAWMDMQSNTIDFVVGPIETYEDALNGYKASHSGQILVKDKVWSKKLSEYAALLPRLQNALPVPAKYKAEKAKSNADMNAYDVIYYAGDCNAGSKNIAINLPNDPRVHAAKGSRKLQLKNAMQAKFDMILTPIAKLVMNPEQLKYVSFDAFFENTMFHEVAHGLGINYTLKSKKSVRDVLADCYTSIEEGKADILGLYLITKLHEWKVITDKDLMCNYVTFMAGTFRSVRFGAASAHGKSNMMRYNYFAKVGAFTRDDNGIYTVNFEKMQAAMNHMVTEILTIQGDGNYELAKQMIKENGVVPANLQADLDRINNAGIPKDIRYVQGAKVLGL
jgi:hypothetical protein